MSETRIIKKYPNRRLYDTAISSYITLEDVKRLVIEQTAIKVIDARTQEDITHSTLLQIIVEQEEKGPSLFSTDSLQNMIRTYGHSMQMLVNKMFDSSISLFTNQYKMFNKDNPQMSLEAQDPAKMMNEIAQQNLAHWQKWQQQWLSNFSDEQFKAQTPEKHESSDENDSLRNPT